VRPTIAAIVGVHLVLFVAPPLLSRDVFNYLEYGRVFALHGLDPYAHGAGVLAHDAAQPFMCCKSSPDPYGPGFTLLAAALAKLGLPTSFWVMKALLTGSALVAVALVWRCAQRLGRSPVAAAAYVGLNPVGVVFAAGGPHNDWLMMAVVLAGVLVFLGRSQAGGAALAVSAVAVKASALVVAPFMVAASDRRVRTALAAGGAGVAVVALLALVFGPDAVRGFVHALSQQQNGEFLRSVPQVIASSGLSIGVVRAVLTTGLVLLAGWQLWRVTRGADWLTASGWTTLGVLASSSWLLPWYGVWLLPAAALSRDRSLKVAGLAATAYLIWARAPLLV
jgi:hypothetical protein